MSTLVASPRMTASEYLAWDAEQLDRHEFHRGDVYAMAGGTPRHNALSAAVMIELGLALRGSLCRVLSSDHKIAARDGQHYVYADASVATFSAKPTANGIIGSCPRGGTVRLTNDVCLAADTIYEGIFELAGE